MLEGLSTLELTGIVIALWLVLWTLVNLKKSRADGTYIKTHPYRNMMFHLMPTANGSIVFFDDWVQVDELYAFIAEQKEHFHVDITHCIVAAYACGLTVVPKMDRFVMGRRLYQHKKPAVTFSMKRKKKNQKAKLATVKMELEPDDSFETFVRKINQRIGIERSEKKTYTDKELSLFLLLPNPLLNVLVRLFNWLNHKNLLPYAFTKADPFHTSAFIANLGSLGMRAGYHHLYEWGTCPLFVMIGRTEELPVVVDGEIQAARRINIRFTYDERIDDGLSANVGIEKLRHILENPRDYFGEPGLPEAERPRLKREPPPENL